MAERMAEVTGSVDAVEAGGPRDWGGWEEVATELGRPEISRAEGLEGYSMATRLVLSTFIMVSSHKLEGGPTDTFISGGTRHDRPRASSFRAWVGGSLVTEDVHGVAMLGDRPKGARE